MTDRLPEVASIPSGSICNVAAIHPVSLDIVPVRLRRRLFAAVRTLAWATIGLLSAGAHAADVLYATGVGSGPNAGLSGLYSLDPSNGTSTLLWNFNDIHIYGGGLAYDPGSDLLYATGVKDSDTGTTRLFGIDRYSGVASEIGPVGDGLNLSFGGLAINPLTGVMYATGAGNQSTGLFTIDKHAGAATLVGLSGGQCCVAPFGFNIYGLGFGKDGTLWANGLTLSTPGPDFSHLYTLDLTTGAAADIGAHGVVVGRQVTYSGLAFRDDGVLLSMGSVDAASGGLFAIDTFTGAATSLSGSGIPYGSGPIHFGVDGGLAFAPTSPAPEPESYALMLAGLALMGVFAQRRTQPVGSRW